MHPARERLLEGFLMRLAIARDAEAFALRGGMLVRSWVPGRRVRDLDLVCSLPYQPRAIETRLREILATHVDDGTTFDAERFRVDRWPSGLSVFAIGELDGAIARLVVDLTFQLDIWPAAVPSELAMTRGTARIWTCPHEDRKSVV